MNGRARVLVLVAYVIMIPSLAGAQVSMQPAPRPLVTAENEGWYRAGEPITFSGNLYYPAGAQVYFDANQMVRTGAYLGIPLYALTTEEPYSRVYVPLTGGLMQPYERRRAGEVAGTVGSTAPSYPVALPAEESNEAARSPAGIAQAAAPPMFAPFANEPGTAPRANATLPLPEAPTAGAVATIGEALPGPAPVSGGAQTALKPKGLNGVFVEYDNRRWFNSGPAVLLDPARFTRIGDYHGFNVYQVRAGAANTIYVQLADNVTTYATPYSLRR